MPRFVTVTNEHGYTVSLNANNIEFIVIKGSVPENKYGKFVTVHMLSGKVLNIVNTGCKEWKAILLGFE